MNQFIISQTKFCKLFLQIRKRDPCIQQRTEQHVSANAGKRFYK